jgi:hypothetical protein
MTRLARYRKLAAYREALIQQYAERTRRHAPRRKLWETLRDVTTQMLRMEISA